MTTLTYVTLAGWVVLELTLRVRELARGKGRRATIAAPGY